MLERLTTETRNDKTIHLDEMTIQQCLTVMNDEDAKVALAVKEEIATIATAVEAVSQAFQQGGRLIYMGAGTSGRIGLMDAVECPPTFSTPKEQVVGLLAGGQSAFIQAVEGAEDQPSLGEKDLRSIHLCKEDVVIGIAASGRTPYVAGGLNYANSVGATTVSISCNKQAAISSLATIAIEVDNGPEVLTGSTRLKAATAQKLICNMISTTAMVRTGKVYGNLMVDVQLTNEKLKDRAKRIVMLATSCSSSVAQTFLKKADQSTKLAIVMILTGLSKEAAQEKLQQANGFISKSL